MAKSGIHLGLVDLSSDVPLLEAFCVQEWYSVGSSLPELRCTPQYRHLVAQGGIHLGLVDLSSAVPLW